MLKRKLAQEGVQLVSATHGFKNDYLAAMRESVVDPSHLKALLNGALTDKINDRETYMKGIDYSYYYEQE